MRKFGTSSSKNLCKSMLKKSGRIKGGKWFQKGCVFALTAALSVSLLACGSKNKNSESDASGMQEAQGYVYVPEYLPLEQEENANMNTVVFQDDRMYYSTYNWNEETGESIHNLCYRVLDSMDTEVILPVSFEAPEGYEANMGDFFFDAEGNLYLMWHLYPVYVEGKEYDYEDNTIYIVKYDNQASQLWAADIGEAFTDENNRYIQDAVVSKEGKIYASSNNVVYVFGTDGAYLKTIPINTDWINGMVEASGRVFITQYGMNGMELVEIDTATDVPGATFGKLPDSNGTILDGGEGKLLISGSSKLYEYDLATQESGVMLDWIDCNIDGNYAQNFTVLADGRIAVFYNNYEDGAELTLLTKTEASKVTQKQVLTLATLHEGNSTLQRAAVAFNKANKEYQIKIRTYIDNTVEWTETTYSDAIARLNADIVGNDCPDIIDLSNVDLNNLAGKSALEDLTPYLEASTTANKSMFVPSVLNAYNIGGAQVTVPKYFYIATLLAKTSLVGEKSGWTLKDVIALADAHPEASLMHYVNKESALQLCMQFASDTFIDYATGKCNFESPEFIQVLEFANRFEEERDYEESLPTMIQSGKILLSQVSYSRVEEYQMYNLMFEDETTNIGFPTFDGSAGVFIMGSETYGISAKSNHKDGAWQFIESILADYDEDRNWNFPSNEAQLNKVFEEAMTPDYQYDEKGQIMKDEQGNPLQYPKTSWGYDDWDVDIYAASQKEVDEIKDMIEVAKPMAQGDQMIYSMIAEEAAAYFEGQKTAEEVAKIIQSRVEIYVSSKS